MTAAARVEPIRNAQALAVRPLLLSDLHAAPWNARRSFDEASLAELKASIEQHGILVPLIVRPDGNKAGYEIVAGHRRFMAAGLAKLAAVPADVRELSDEEAREIGMVDNLQREDLTALDEAEGYQQIFALAGEAGRRLTPAALAAKIGKPEGYVRLRLRLLTLDEAARSALREGRIVLGHAIELARLEAAAQKEVVSWLLTDRFGGRPRREDQIPGVRELKRHILDEVLLELREAPFDTKDAQLVPAAGSCVDCPKRTGNAKLLFADVRDKDICTDPVCFRAKVARLVDVTVAALTAKGEKAVRISDDYSRDKDTPKEALVSSQCILLRYSANREKPCPARAMGVYVDGCDRGKTEPVCTDRKCKVHTQTYSSSGSATPQDAQRRAKARQEKECRMRIARAIVEKTEGLTLAVEAAIRSLASRLFDRSHYQGSQAVSEMLGWPKDTLNHSGRDREARLAKLKVGRLVAVALLASASGELSVSEYAMGKPEELEKAAERYAVDVARIRKEVAAEFAAKKQKAAKKSAQGGQPGAGAAGRTAAAPGEAAAAPAKAAKKTVLTAAARRRIAAAQKRRRAKTQKGGGK